ncbi:hypothetical protein [Streptomyces sp. MST-110588]|uniref:terpene synthase family protein n=1 Tax=Streptomyces sp. MST-110588 TaxID=2833628 RepID=UPI001F5DBFFC|nr:hypothetical protein [Streptomyces sp. MST-110588]UNO42931.1 hypothetical protein KGS77_29765 [Streptomyces sp. MST-110588]
MTSLSMNGLVLPTPTYSFPDRIAPWADAAEREIEQWMGTDFAFLSDEARAQYAATKFGHLASRCYGAAVDQLRLIACTRMFTMATVFDDYYEPCTVEELTVPIRRTVQILKGAALTLSDNGIMHSLATLRKELLAFADETWMDRFIHNWTVFVTGMQAEAPYKQSKTTPSLVDTLDIRTASVGIVASTDMIEIATGRPLPPHIASHPTIIVLKWLTSRVMAIQNDLYSLSKEIARGGTETINVVLCLQRERRLSLQDAYTQALELHDEIVHEISDRITSLPDFGSDQQLAREYAANLGVMIQGCKSWYERDTKRFRADAAGYAASE